jgi:uncharacterized RDD family membrane protein YckC
MMSDERTWYDVLGVEPSAPKSDVKTAYHDALSDAQQAENGDEVAQVRRAWQVLSDPVQRQRYDEEIGLNQRGALDGGTDVEVDGNYDDEGDEYDGDESDVEIVDEGPVGRRPRPSALLETAEFLELPALSRRLVASLIDVVLIVGLFFASITLTYWLTGADSGLPGLITFVGWVEFWIIVFFLIPTWRTGQTLGKRFTWVMCVDRATGNLCSTRQVILRYIAPMVVIPVLLQMGAFLALFYGLSYALGRDQVSLADRLAKTAVVIARYRPTRAG